MVHERLVFDGCRRIPAHGAMFRCSQGFHLAIGEFEVENFGILDDAVLVNGFRQWNIALFHPKRHRLAFRTRIGL